MLHRQRIHRLEDRVLLSATPEASVENLPDQHMINEAFSFVVSFDNTAAPSDPQGTGYGPYVDVTVGPGIEVNSVSYLGSTVTSQVVGTWNGTSWVDGNGQPVTAHPLDPSGTSGLAQPTGTAVGQTWLYALVPFGSYTPEQPVANLTFNATLEQGVAPDPGAIPGTPVQVTAQGGFRYGLDPLENPSTDPAIQQPGASTDSVTPIVMEVSKAVQLPESETAQGPNFPFTYTISVDIATNISLTDINVQDLLPDNLFFLNATTSIAASSATAPGVNGAPQGVPGLDTVTTAQWIFGTTTAVVGQAGGGDIVITLTAYAPEFDAQGNPVIDPESPTTAIATNHATATADFDGVPVDATTGGSLEDSVDIAIRPYTVLKSVTVEGGGSPVPGKFLRFEVDVDVSDYQAFDNLVLNDTLADGLSFDTTDLGAIEHTPVLQIEQDGQVFLIDLTQAIPAGDEAELASAINADNTQALTFFISAALRNNGYDGSVTGDLFNGDPQQGPTHATLVYYALIDNNYRDPARGTVVTNDVLGNSVSMNATSVVSGNDAQSDGSSSSVTVPSPTSEKSVYAINGVVGGDDTVAPGDLVTYRIRVQITDADVNNLVISDFLPSPVYDVDGNGTGFQYVDTQGGVPAAYTIIRGPDDTLTGAANVAGVPGVTTDGANNSLSVDYGSFSILATRNGVVDLLYTVQATDQPFADGLLLVNQGVIRTGDSVSEVVVEENVVHDIVLRQPVLSLTKGVVATDANGAVDNSLAFDPTTLAPGKMTFAVGTDGFTTSSTVTESDLAATPITSDMTGFDGGDTVKFAVVVQNTGGQDAFDVVLRDTLPAGFVIPAGAVLTVQYGDGSAVSFTGDINDFFGTGITLDDGAGIGSMAATGAANGHDVVIVSYELVAVDDIAPHVTTTNGAELVSFAAIEGGNDFTAGVEGNFTDSVDLTAQGVAIAKHLVTTDQDFTTGNDLTIGELATFQIEVTVPDGATSVTVNDAVPTGLSLVGAPTLLLTFTNASGVTQTFEGTVSQGGISLANGTVLAFTPSGNGFTIDFGAVAAASGPGTNVSGQTFAISYQAVAIDVASNQAGTTLNNAATMDTPTTDPVGPVAAPVDIVSPNLTISKQFLPDEAQANQVVAMRLVITNNSGTFSTTSFGLDLTDDDMLKSIFGSVFEGVVTGTGGVDTSLVTVTIDDTDPNAFLIHVVGTPDFAMAPGEQLILTFGARVLPDVVIGSTLVNTATVNSYSTLPGDDPDERTLGPTSGSDTLVINNPTITKTLLNTSLGGTDAVADPDPNVLVGEVLTYQIMVTFPDGVAENVVISDNTDFASLVGAQGVLQLVSVDSIFIGSRLTVTNPQTPGDAIFADTNEDGIFDYLQLSFGTVTNPPGSGTDPEDEAIIIVVRAQVMNVLATDDGDQPVNQATVTFDVDGVTQSSVAEDTVTVHEPAIDVQKAVSTPDTTPDAGDVVTYTLTLRHNASSSADGYELELTDQLPPEMVLVPGSVTVSAPTAAGLDPLTIGDVTLDTASNRVIASGFDLGLNQVATITYQARIANTVVSDEVLTNQVALTYKSLPDLDPADGLDPSVAQGVAGAESERRDGSDGAPRTDQSILNNYAFDTSASVTIAQPGPIDKTADKSTYTIGEEVTYTIRVPVIEGLTVDPVMVDTLPAGFDFIEGSGTIVRGDGTPVLTGFTLTQVGQTLTLETDPILMAADNDASNDFFLITFRTKVLDTADNNLGDVKPNTVTFSSQGQPDRSDGVSVGVVEPQIVMSKTTDTTGPVDAGDVVTVTVTASHSSQSTANAYEFAFTDDLPADMEGVSIVSATVNGVDVSSQLVFNGSTLVGTDIDIPLGATLTLVYQVRVLDTAGPNETITNTAQGTWTSLDGEVPGERTGIPGDPVDDYVTTASASVVTDDLLLVTKSIDAPDSDFAIGETVPYVLDITVLEGTLTNVVVTDTLDPGLIADLSSLQVVASGFAGGTVTILNPTLTMNAQGFTTLSFELDNDPTTAGSQVVNPGDPAGDTTANDTIRVTFNAVVANVVENQDSVERNNTVGVSADDVGLVTGTEQLTVVEPMVTAAKTLLTPVTSVDAGDVLTYQVVLTNTGTSTAFDTTFLDTAPPSGTFVGTVTAVDALGNPVGAFVIAPDGSTLTGSGIDIPVGGSVTVTYSLQVDDTIQQGDTLTNAVDVRWTSTAGANSNERTGADGVGGALNDYAAEGSVTVPAALTFDIDKTVQASSVASTTGTDVTIGETVTYRLRVSLSEGSFENLTLEDVLPAGQRYVPGSVTITPGNPAGSGTFANAALVGNTLVVTGIDLVNPGDNNAGNDFIDITYNVVIENILGNQDGVALPNTATLTAPSGTTVSDDANVEIVEPVVVADKVVLPFDEQISAGSVIDYQVVLTNTGTSTAYDVDVLDTAPAIGTFTGTVTAVDNLGNTVGTFVITNAGQTLSGSDINIPVGGTVTVTYSLLVADNVQSDDLIVNDVVVDWTSTPGANADERTGADGQGPDATTLNNYEDSDVTVVFVGQLPLAVEKTVVDSSVDQTTGTDVAVGEIVTYRVRVTLPEGTTQNFRLDDVLPAGQVFIVGSARAEVSNPGMSVTVGGTSVSGNVLSITGVTVVNPGDNDPTNDFIDIFYNAVIQNDPVTVDDGNILPNTVTITTGNGLVESDDANVTVVEPDLTIDKTVDAPFVEMGDSAQYEIVVAHSDVSSVDAFDIVIADPFNDPAIVLDPGSVTATIVGGPAGLPPPVIQYVGSGFRIVVEDLPLGASVIVNFSATASEAAAANGASATNTATLNYDSIPGIDLPNEQRDYSASDTATVTIAGPDLQVIKDASVGVVVPGQVFSYTVQVLNKGAPGVDAGDIENATNVLLTDRLPDDISLVALRVNGALVPFTVDPTTGLFTVNLGTIAPDETVVLQMLVRVADVLSPVDEINPDRFLLINTAGATMDDNDPTPFDNIDSAAVNTNGSAAGTGPDLFVVKTNNVEETGGSELVEFTITAGNTGQRVAANVDIVDTIDTTVFDFVSASNGGVFDPTTGTVTWHLDTLSPIGGPEVFTMVLKVKPGLSPSIDETTNRVTISDNGFAEPDPTPENNFDSHTDRLVYPDLVVIKTDNVTEVSPGDTVTYTITVDNEGEFRADGVRVSDFADPRVFRFVSASDGGVYDPATGRVTWLLGTVSPDDPPITLTVTFEVLFPSSFDLEDAANLVEVNGDGTRGLDANPGNNVAVDIDALAAFPDPSEIARIFRTELESEEEEEEPFEYAAPIITGTAGIGSTVSVVFVGPDGTPIGGGSSMTGPDGTWMVTAPGFESNGPVSAIVVTAPGSITGIGPLDRTNVQFAPGLNGPIPFVRQFDLYSADDFGSELILDAQMAATENPYGLTGRRYVNFDAPTAQSLVGG